MPRYANRWRPARAIALFAGMAAVAPALAQTISALPDQPSRIRLSNRDINHIICVGGEIEDVKFSAEKGLAVERGGADAWIKFLVRESEEDGATSRTYASAPSEFFVSCNGAIYPLHAEPSDIPAQTIALVPGPRQRARANDVLLGPLVEEERAVSIALALLQDRVPASFAELAPRADLLRLAGLPAVTLRELRRLDVAGSGLSASEYRLVAGTAATLDERNFLDRTLGADIVAVTLDRLALQAGDQARLILVRREMGQ